MENSVMKTQINTVVFIISSVVYTISSAVFIISTANLRILHSVFRFPLHLKYVFKVLYIDRVHSVHFLRYGTAYKITRVWYWHRANDQAYSISQGQSRDKSCWEICD